LELKLRDVHEGWHIIGVLGSPDDIYLSIYTDRYDPIETYDSLRHLVKLYECALEECPSDDHPVRGGYSVEERGDKIVVELRPHATESPKPVETTYEKLRGALAPFLADVFRRLDSQSSDEERARGIEHMALNYSFFTDFRDLYGSLTGRKVE
jgi:hypothetical protein